MTVPDDLHDAALHAAHRGWYVFPLVPGSQIPALHGVNNCPRTGACAQQHHGWEQRATRDLDLIRTAWTTAPFNIGIACGPSRIVVVDLDTPKPGDPPGTPNGRDQFADLCRRHGHDVPIDTFTVTTQSGGTHLYFAHPASGPALRNTCGHLAAKVDTRAHGGLVVAAGSRTPTGTYDVVHDVVPAPLPAWLAQLLTPRPLPPQQPVTVTVATGSGRRERYVQAAVQRQLDHIARATPGDQRHGRNYVLYYSAVALGQLVAGNALTEDYVRDVLTAAALRAGLEPREIDRTITSGLRDGAKRPRTVAA